MLLKVGERSDQAVFSLYLIGIISFPLGMFFELIYGTIPGDLWMPSLSAGKFSVSLLDLSAIIVQWGVIGLLAGRMWYRFRG